MLMSPTCQSYVASIAQQSTSVPTLEDVADDNSLDLPNANMDEDTMDALGDNFVDNIGLPRRDMSSHNHSVTCTTADYLETKLLKVLDDANAPLFLYEDLLKWASKYAMLGYNFQSKQKNQSAQVS